MKISEKSIIFGIAILSFILSLIFLSTSPILLWDETVYANLGYDLSQNPLDYSVENNGWSDYIPSGDNPEYNWPKIGFRAPLLPYTLSLFYLFKLHLFIPFFIPLIGALSVGLIYKLGKELFNKEVGIYSALFLALTPLYAMSNSKILTGTYAITLLILTIFCFWKGYEKNEPKYNIFFGVLFALALLARYTALWFVPIFFFYLLIRKKSLKFVISKDILISIGAFFLTLTPWLIYGYLEYGNIFGAFIHGGRAAIYWGGHQSWSFYFKEWLGMFSIVGILALAGIGKMVYMKKKLRPEFLLLILWTLGITTIAMFMPHKEERFILPLVPGLCLIAGVFLHSIKKYKKLILLFSLLILMISISTDIRDESKINFQGEDKIRVNCFIESAEYLGNLGDVRVLTDESSVTYHYTRQRTNYYPSELTSEGLIPIIEELNPEERIYLIFPQSILKQPERERKYLEQLQLNWKQVYKCEENNSLGVYEYVEDYLVV